MEIETQTFGQRVLGRGLSTASATAWYARMGDSFRPIRWRTMASAVVQVCEWLDRRGIGAGDRLLSQLPNGCAWACLESACSLLGVIHIPLDPKTPIASLKAYLTWYEPKALLVGLDSLQIARSTLSLQECPNLWALEGFESSLSTVSKSHRPSSDVLLYLTEDDVDESRLVSWGRQEVDLDSPATILTTSGTSGKRKGVILSHRNLDCNAHAKLHAMPQYETDIRWNILPFAHAYARTCELTTWAISGSSMACASSLTDFWERMPDLKPTLINAVPYIYREGMRKLLELESIAEDRTLLEKRFRLLFGDRLRMIASGGAGLSKEVATFYRSMGWPIHQGYGLTEASPVVFSQRSHSIDFGPRIPSPITNASIGEDVGPPVTDVEVRIDDRGELWVRGPNVMLGYWRDPEATTQRIVDGWLRTQDRVERTASGHFRILGRGDDCIVLSNGRKVDPSPLEIRLLSSPWVEQCMMVGSGRDEIGILIVPTSLDSTTNRNVDGAIPTSTEEWKTHIREWLNDFEHFAIPKRIQILTRPWTMEAGELTAKGTIIRQNIQKGFQDTIEAMYG